MSTLVREDLPVADEVAAQEWFHERNMTDGLPIVVPTTARVAEFIDASGFDPTRAVGLIEPAGGHATVENVAVNAVMAGAKPAHLGVILAALESMTKPRFNLRGVQTTTNPVAPLTIVGGPVTKELGLSTGGHAFSGGREPNVVIGRAIRLALRNLGGADNDVSQSSLALPARLAFCVAEDEDRSPWEPHHVSIGYGANDSVVTTVGVESILDVVSFMWADVDQMIRHHVETMRAVGSNLLMGQGAMVWLMGPPHARFYAEHGYDRQRLQEVFFERTKFDRDEWPFGLPGEELRDISTADASKGWIEAEQKLKITTEPSDILIVVAGRDDPIHSSYLPPMCFSDWTSAKVWEPDGA